MRLDLVGGELNQVESMWGRTRWGRTRHGAKPAATLECFQYFQRSLQPTNQDNFDFYSLRKRHHYINVG